MVYPNAGVLPCLSMPISFRHFLHEAGFNWRTVLQSCSRCRCIWEGRTTRACSSCKKHLVLYWLGLTMKAEGTLSTLEASKGLKLTDGMMARKPNVAMISSAIDFSPEPPVEDLESKGPIITRTEASRHYLNRIFEDQTPS